MNNSIIYLQSLVPKDRHVTSSFVVRGDFVSNSKQEKDAELTLLFQQQWEIIIKKEMNILSKQVLSSSVKINSQGFIAVSDQETFYCSDRNGMAFLTTIISWLTGNINTNISEDGFILVLIESDKQKSFVQPVLIKNGTDSSLDSIKIGEIIEFEYKSKLYVFSKAPYSKIPGISSIIVDRIDPNTVESCVSSIYENDALIASIFKSEGMFAHQKTNIESPIFENKVNQAITTHKKQQNDLIEEISNQLFNQNFSNIIESINEKGILKAEDAISLLKDLQNNL